MSYSPVQHVGSHTTSTCRHPDPLSLVLFTSTNLNGARMGVSCDRFILPGEVEFRGREGAHRGPDGVKAESMDLPLFLTHSHTLTN